MLNTNQATVVIYPAIGFFGSTNCVVASSDATISSVRAMGRTVRERFDLAVEVPARKYRGVTEAQVNESDVPALFRSPWSVVSSI